MNFFFRFLLPILAGGALAAPAFAQTVINSVPFTINASGKYVLGNNFVVAANQNAIVVNAPNVIVDLNGFFVSGPGTSTTTTVAVISVGNVSNVTIRNGTVANGGTGIFFSSSGTNSINHLVEDVNVTRCLNQGIYFFTDSAGSIVRRNVISQTGGSTAFADSNALAIVLSGGVRAEKNVITGLTPTGTFRAIGIAGTATDFMIANTLSGAAGSGSIGISGGKYQRNLTASFATPVTGGTDAGGNF